VFANFCDMDGIGGKFVLVSVWTIWQVLNNYVFKSDVKKIKEIKRWNFIIVQSSQR
jgi:hypothetical protein